MTFFQTGSTCRTLHDGSRCRRPARAWWILCCFAVAALAGATPGIARDGDLWDRASTLGVSWDPTPAEVARELESLGERLGIELPEETDQKTRTLHLIGSYEEVAHDRELSMDPRFPGEMLRHLALVLAAVPPRLWEEGASVTGDEERALLGLVAEVVKLSLEKLDRLAVRTGKSRHSASRFKGDPCRTAEEISDGVVAVDTVGAWSGGFSACDTGAGAGDVWFRYTAPRAGVASFRSADQALDTVVSVHRGCSGEHHEELVCNDDAPFTTGSQASVRVEPGDVLWVRVAGQAGTTGSTLVTAETGLGISGTVRASQDGTPIAGAGVWFFQDQIDLWSFIGSTTTGADGGYVQGALDPGTYYVVVRHADFVDQLYEGLPCPQSFCSAAGGTPVTISMASVEGIDFDLETTGAISGTVHPSLTAGASPSGSVVADRVDGRVASIEGAISGDGSYLIEGLAPGDYWVHTSTDFSDEVYDDVLCGLDCDPATGVAVSVPEAATTAGIDFVLEGRGGVAGSVVSERTGRPLSTVQVWVWHESGLYGISGQTDSAGEFLISGLQPGSYFLYVSERGYFAEVYDNVPCSKPCESGTWSTGTAVAVSPASTTEGIVFALRSEGTIIGSVQAKADGAPVAGSVFVLSPGGGVRGGSDIDDATGAYLVEGLEPGEYRVEADPSSIDYQVEVYDDFPCSSGQCQAGSGTPVNLALGEERVGVDFLLSLCSHSSYLTLTSPVNAPNSWTACEEITAGPMTLQNGADVHLTAGRKVVLSDGFVVEAGGKLRIAIDRDLSGEDP